jgi:hypothetical protein
MSIRTLLPVLLGVLVAVLGRRRLPTAGGVFPKGKVKEIMVTDPLTVEASALLVDVARRMRDANVGMLPIVDSGRLCGVITDRDLVVRSVAWVPTPLPCASVTSRPPTSCGRIQAGPSRRRCESWRPTSSAGSRSSTIGNNSSAS